MFLLKPIVHTYLIVMISFIHFEESRFFILVIRDSEKQQNGKIEFSLLFIHTNFHCDENHFGDNLITIE